MIYLQVVHPLSPLSHEAAAPSTNCVIAHRSSAYLAAAFIQTADFAFILDAMEPTSLQSQTQGLHLDLQGSEYRTNHDVDSVATAVKDGPRSSIHGKFGAASCSTLEIAPGMEGVL